MSASVNALSPTTIAVEGRVLEDLRSRLRGTIWPEADGNEDGRYGVPRALLQELAQYWAEEYDWRAAERAMNAYEHYLVDVSGTRVHFMRKPGVGPDPTPLILSHGWPWTFWHWSRVIDRLADPAAFGGHPADAFDVIVPSLPGFGYSTPTQPDMNFWKIADVWHELMTQTLGHTRYAAAGCAGAPSAYRGSAFSATMVTVCIEGCLGGRRTRREFRSKHSGEPGGCRGRFRGDAELGLHRGQARHARGGHPDADGSEVSLSAPHPAALEHPSEPLDALRHVLGRERAVAQAQERSGGFGRKPVGTDAYQQTIIPGLRGEGLVVELRGKCDPQVQTAERHPRKSGVRQRVSDERDHGVPAFPQRGACPLEVPGPRGGRHELQNGLLEHP